MEDIIAWKNAVLAILPLMARRINRVVNVIAKRKKLSFSIALGSMEFMQKCRPRHVSGTKPFTHIISHPDTRYTIYIKTLHCLQQFSANSIHS